ncbi:MAG: ABC transporter ATP-binding protein [Ruminococcaceae bacterium]|nr:ABC transporter ATP-binding protein [Oscillospiraceae bacterium]
MRRWKMITLENLQKTYPAAHGENSPAPVLRGVLVNIEKGDFVAIMGKSGCGKSTLLNILGCLDDYTGGRYLLYGKEVAAFNSKQKARARSKTFGFVFQSFHLLASETVLDNVKLPLRYSDIPKKDYDKVALSTLESLGIAHLSSKYPSALSGGEQQRAAIARALVNSPDVILADEPTGNLDSDTGKLIMKTLTRLHEEAAKTIILVTHDVKIASYADKLIEMRDGVIANCFSCKKCGEC